MRKALTWIAIAIVMVIIVVGAVYVLLSRTQTQTPVIQQGATSTPVTVHTIIGHTVQGRAIDAYSYGTGPTHVVFVGGMHGGYEWNAVVLAYDFKQYLDAHPSVVPSNETVTVIPDLNVDGTFAVTGKIGPITPADIPAGADTVAGRKNADNVDLNRNFACHWQSISTWQNKPESAGTAAFSEPEAQALRSFVLVDHPSAVIFWHSASGNVYAAHCDSPTSQQDIDIMNAYAQAAGYGAVKSFDAYPITGDSESWLASIGIAPLTVELTNHTDVEWQKNLAGINAVMKYYAHLASTTATSTPS